MNTKMLRDNLNVGQCWQGFRSGTHGVVLQRVYDDSVPMRGDTDANRLLPLHTPWTSSF